MKVEEQKRKAKFDFGLYCLEFCPLFTLAISRAIHVIWTHPSILSYPLFYAEMKFFLLSADFLFLTKIFGNKICQTCSKQLKNEILGWYMEGFLFFQQWPLSWLFTHEYMEQALGNTHLVWMTRPVHCFSSINIIVIT